ncbi:MAG: phage tail protein [Thalassobius sp.]|nr:phage tail protein [Thalassovita sp.]|tara:strand:+ start:157 stop:543 length:387 start_codon:yes stop_codon:yes gene_type:complete
MKNLAELNVGEVSELPIESYNYELEKSFFEDGKPSSRTRGGTISITIQGSLNIFFFDWMCSPVKRQSGSIVIRMNDSSRVLNFEDAYLISYKENFERFGNPVFTETIVISAKKIEMDGNYHENEWSDM